MSVKKQDHQGEQSLDAICRFSGHLAHELNNLLTPIIACGQMMRDSMKKNDPLYFCAEQIAEAGDRCLALSRKLQVIGSRRTGGHVLSPASLIPEGIKASGVSPASGVVIKELYRDHADAQNALIKVDMEQFVFCMAELVRNSAAAMTAGGSIEVDTRELVTPGGLFIVVSIRDNGSGMTEEVLTRMYEPFFSTQGQERDKGLGLTLVYGIVRRAGGHIVCNSQPGAGTTFELHFPAAAPSPA